MFILTYLSTYIYIYMRTYLDIFCVRNWDLGEPRGQSICIYIYSYIHIYIYICLHIYIYIYQNIKKEIYIYLDVFCVRNWDLGKPQSQYVSIYIAIYIYIYAYLSTYIYIKIWRNKWIYTWMYSACEIGILASHDTRRSIFSSTGSFVVGKKYWKNTQMCGSKYEN